MCNGTIMTDDKRMEMLENHDFARTGLQKGNNVCSNCTKFPTAENFYKFTWSCELEELANRFVQGCQQSPPSNAPAAHAYNFRGYPYDNGNTYNEEVFMAIAINKWIDEAIGAKPTNIFEELKITNLSNIFNSATLKIGCSAQICGGGIIATVACFYENPFLKLGDPMYTPGPPCTLDADCTAYSPAICDSTALLCQIEDTATSTIIESTLTSTTVPSTINTTTAPPTMNTTTSGNSNSGINQICIGNVYMNDRIRIKARDMHNYRRSQLAKGEVAKFNGNKLPSAANMVELTYNCELEKTAYAHATTCSNDYSNSDTRPGTAENIYMASGSSVPYRVDAMAEAINFWWKQIRLQTQSIGMAVTFKQTHLQSPVRFFTMMAWATTTKFGCGVAKCSGGFFVVCHYQPGGNVVGATVYSKGTTCSQCPTGTYCSSPLCVLV